VRSEKERPDSVLANECSSNNAEALRMPAARRLRSARMEGDSKGALQHPVLAEEPERSVPRNRTQVKAESAIVNLGPHRVGNSGKMLDMMTLCGNRERIRQEPPTEIASESNPPGNSCQTGEKACFEGLLKQEC